MTKLKMKKIKLIGLFLFGICALGTSQSMKAFIEEATKSFEEKDYYSALSYYSEALEFDDSRTDLMYKAAEAARNFDAYAQAETKYQMVVDNDTSNEYPLANYYLAEMKQRRGNYEEASRFYELYKAEAGAEDDPYFAARAAKEMAACKWAKELVENPDSSITVTHLENVNSPYSDFAAVEHKDELYFSALKYENKNDGRNPHRTNAKILKSTGDSKGKLLKGIINDNDQHIAHTAFSKDGSKMYYTVCNYLNDQDIQCQIYYALINEDQSLGTAVKLPENINLEGFTATQPNIGYDEALDKEVLYFVSDRVGGKGKLDVWSSVIDANWSFSEPKNLGINTIEDDISPFYHRGSKTLYFSSMGYQSMGGFDIYSTTMKEGGLETPTHLNAPVNGSYHDLYYSINEDATMAHFSSNREGAYYLDESKEACCFDIYKAEYEEVIIDLNALTFDADTKEPLDDVLVQIYDEDTGELIAEISSVDTNEHLQTLDRNKNYKIIATKDGYTSDEILFNTYDIFKSEEIIKKLYLKADLVTLDVLTFDEVSRAALIGCNVKLINTDTGEIVGETQYNNSANDFHWSLLRNVNYKIIASKDGYRAAESTFNTSGIIEGNKILKKLYLIRDINTYLPIRLYFDNDIPDKRSRGVTTTNTYTETYNPYILRKDEFKQRYGKSEANQRLEDFFEIDVRGGHDRLELFLSKVLLELRAGQKITMAVKGFASPRATTKYNLALSERRVSSLKNELIKYQDGILSQYINSGSLILENVSYGETLAPAGISDVISDQRNSVYSVEASKERRIEILRVRYNN